MLEQQEQESMSPASPNGGPHDPLPYEEHYTQISSGDLVFIGGAKSLFSWIISAVTRSVFSHVGIACWMYDHCGEEPELFIIEASPSGRRLVSMSHYGMKRPMTVIKSPIEWNLYRKTLLAGTGRIPYGYLDLIGIGLRETLRIKTKDFDGEVCSEMVATVLNANGFPIEKLQSPGRLYRTLLKRSCEIKLVTAPK